jgi:hypothetical protein
MICVAEKKKNILSIDVRKAFFFKQSLERSHAYDEYPSPLYDIIKHRRSSFITF